MTQYAIVTDLERCVGCLSCMSACKMVNNVPIGSYWNKVLRIGPTPQYEGAISPDVDLYWIPVSCQHCAKPECVKVCPTGASYKEEDGTVQVDKEKCIGCQFCVMACPYGVRYLNEEERVVEKCTLCEQRVSAGDLPACVVGCGGKARYFGDLEKGLDSFVALDVRKDDYSQRTYEEWYGSRIKMNDWIRPYSPEQVYSLPDLGNGPSFRYILRRAKWQG